MDTGGLGLLQQLMQSGFPPQLLLQLLMTPPGQATLRPEGGGTGDAPAPDANNDPEGMSGAGNATAGQIASGALGGGAIGQAIAALGGPKVAQSLGAKAATTALAAATGAPATPLGLLNQLLGAAAKAAQGAQRAHGVRTAPLEWGGPRNIPDTPPPDVTFSDSNNVDMGLGLAPTGPPASADLSFTGTAIPDTPAPPSLASFTAAELGIVSNAVANAIDAAANAQGEPSGGPGGPASDGGVGSAGEGPSE